MTRMKGLARSFVWWPGMDGREGKVMYELPAESEDPAPLHPWEWPQKLGPDYTIMLDLSWKNVFSNN